MGLPPGKMDWIMPCSRKKLYILQHLLDDESLFHIFSLVTYFCSPLPLASETDIILFPLYYQQATHPD